MQLLMLEFQVLEYRCQKPGAQHLSSTSSLKCLLHYEEAKQGTRDFQKLFTQSSALKS